jgi:hypothetical protein
MKIQVRYTNKTGTVGTRYFNLDTYSENKMLEEGRKLKATMAHIGKDTARGITYDDKINFKGVKRAVECQSRVEEGGNKGKGKK